MPFHTHTRAPHISGLPYSNIDHRLPSSSYTIKKKKRTKVVAISPNLTQISEGKHKQNHDPIVVTMSACHFSEEI